MGWEGVDSIMRRYEIDVASGPISASDMKVEQDLSYISDVELLRAYRAKGVFDFEHCLVIICEMSKRWADERKDCT